MKRNRWSQADRQRYIDGDRLRASKRPGKRRGGPTVEEFDDEPKNVSEN